MHLSEYLTFYERGRSHHEQFSTATPFPHIILDNFLPPETYTQLCTEFPGPDNPIWKQPENQHTLGKSVIRQGALKLKEANFTQPTRQLLLEFNSSLFLRFLCLLTGIQNLLPDPYFTEGGFHCSSNGGYLDIHADFSHHDLLGLERRVNLLLYLNENWQESYGGELNLYTPELVPAISIAPIGNRVVIFETSETSFHGHPVPMKLPAGVYRKSLALYYYSVPRPDRTVTKIVFPADPTFNHQETNT